MSANGDSLSQIPFLGSGIGFRREIKERILARSDEIDFVEVITEQYAGKAGMWRELAEVGEHFQVIPHGIRLSAGSALPVDMDHLRLVKEIVGLTRAPYYSEHLCMTRAPGIDIGHLSPLWFTEDVLRSTIDTVNRVQDYLEVPLILENVTYTFEIPDSRMSQTEFFNRLVEATKCGVLLDVTNVYINSVNHGFDAEKFLDEMPLERVVQLHLAGGYWSGDRLIDGHCEVVEDGTWEVLGKLAARTSTVKGSILEHDANFPEDFDLLMGTVTKAKEVMGWSSARRPATVGAVSG